MVKTTTSARDMRLAHVAAKPATKRPALVSRTPDPSTFILFGATGDLATRNYGSHYGFIEQGVVYSKLQPGLSTIFVLDVKTSRQRAVRQSLESLERAGASVERTVTCFWCLRAAFAFCSSSYLYFE